MKKFVIIGASAAGFSAAIKLAQLAPEDQIIVCADQAENPYNKCFLADVLSSSKKLEDIYLRDSQNVAHKIEWKLQTRIVKIDQKLRMIETAAGEQICYDALLLATGARVRIPPIAHLYGGAGVFTFNTAHDLVEIRKYVEMQRVQKVIVIGAGLSGLECADALACQGLHVTVIEKNAHVMSTLCDVQAAQRLQVALEQQGISVITNRTVTHVTFQHGHVQSVLLDNNQIIDTHMVIIATGLQPNIEFAPMLQKEGNGLWVNEYLQTSDPHIWAAGDIITITDPLSGHQMLSCTWPDAIVQGQYAASAMAGQLKKYAGATIITSSSIAGMRIASAGPIHTTHFQMRMIINPELYLKLVYKNDRLMGFLAIGKDIPFALLRRTLLTGQSIQNALLNVLSNVALPKRESGIISQ